MGPVRIVAAATLGAVISPAVQAATIVHQYSTNIQNQIILATPFDVQYGRTLAVTPFDTSLGTLTSVRVVSFAQSNSLMVLGTYPDTCIPFKCVPVPAGGAAIGSLRSDFDTGSEKLWVDLDTGRMIVEHPGRTVAALNLSTSSDRVYSDQDILGRFTIGAPSIRLSHTLSMIGLFSGIFVPGDTRVTSNAVFGTQVYYDYTPFDVEVPGPGVPSAVPEPSTWAMMIMGFGVIGSALRRRRRATAHRAFV